MTTLIKQIVIVSCIIASQPTQTILWEDVDYKTFYTYIKKATNKLAEVHDQLQYEDHGAQEKLWTGQKFADALYPRQKIALKVLRKELKVLDSQNNNNAMPLNKMFKYEVYNQWKQNFKNNYTSSMQSNDIHAWGWIHQPMHFQIQE